MVIAVHKNYQRDSSTALSSSAPLEVLLYCLEYDEEGGNNEEQTDCAEQHSAYGAYTYGDVAVGSRMAVGGTEHGIVFCSHLNASLFAVYLSC